LPCNGIKGFIIDCIIAHWYNGLRHQHTAPIDWGFFNLGAV